MGSKRPKGKHTDIVNKVVSRLNNSGTLYDLVRFEEEYDDPISKKHGECDVYAVLRTSNFSYLLCFEVKSYDSLKAYNGAVVQLCKDEHYFSQVFDVDRVFKFYVHGFPSNNDVCFERVK